MDEQGRIVSLKRWLDVEDHDKAKPVPLRAEDVRKRWSHPDFSYDFQSAQASVYAKLGVAAAFNASASWEQTTAAWDLLAGFTQVLDQDEVDEDSLIYETFWGVGLRVVLTIQQAAGRLEVNAGPVAAKAELGIAQVEYEVQGIGLGPDHLSNALRAIPPFGKFDLAALDAIDKIRKYLAKSLQETFTTPVGDLNLGQFKPVVVKLATDAALFQDDLDSAAMYRFCMSKIAAGMSWEAASKNIGSFRMSDPARLRKPEEKRLKRLYLELAGVGTEREPPLPEAVARARSWLSPA